MQTHPLIVLSESNPSNAPGFFSQSITSCTEAARLAGCQVYYVPTDFETLSITAEEALWHIPAQDTPTHAAMIAFVQPVDRYQQIYDVLISKNIRMLNTPEEHARIMEFPNFYELISDLTPKSTIVRSIADCSLVKDFPVFVKGAIKSKKESGWDACVAKNSAQLEERWRDFSGRSYSARNLMIAREIVPLRYTRKSGSGFPFGREYRCFLYNNTILGYGYYWGGEDDLAAVSPEEEQAIFELARIARQRVNVPLAVVDIGQVDCGKWIVIELGDPQCCGITQISALQFWCKLADNIGEGG